MYLEDNDIDNLYQDFRNSEATPPADSKEFVMSNIGKKKPIWRFAWLILAFIGLGSLAFLFFPLSGGEKAGNSIANNQSKEQKNPLQGGNQNDLISENKILDTHNQENHNTKISDHKNGNVQIADREINGQYAVQNDIKSDNQDKKKLHSMKSNKKSNDYTAGNKSKKAGAYVQKSNKKDAIEKTNLKPKSKKGFNNDDVKNDLHLANNKLDKDKNDLNPNINNDNIAFNQNDVNKQGNFGDHLQNNEIKVEHSIKNEDLEKMDFNKFKSFPCNVEDEEYIGLINIKPNRTKKLFFGIELNSGYTFSDALTQKNTIAYNEIGMTQYLHGFEIGLNGVMNFRNILFKVGLGYQNQQSSTNYTDATLEIRSTVAYEMILDSNNNPVNVPLFTFVDTTTVSTTYKSKLATSYFVLPVQIGYEFRLRNRWSMDILAGMRFGFLMDVNSSVASLETLDYYQTIDHGRLNKFRMDATIDLGINYQLLEHFGLGLSLPFRIGLNSKMKDSKVLNYGLGGLIKFRYNF